MGRGVLPNHVSIDALLAGEARRQQPVLHPLREEGTQWFDSDPGPRRVIVAAIRRHFNGPWFNISSVPNETLIQWWGQFIQVFYWALEHGAAVYSYWYAITGARLPRLRTVARDLIGLALRTGGPCGRTGTAPQVGVVAVLQQTIDSPTEMVLAPMPIGQVPGLLTEYDK